MLLLSRRQTTALSVFLAMGLLSCWWQAGAAAAGSRELPAPWTARIAVMETNRVALAVAPGLPLADLHARYRQVARDSSAPWSDFRARCDWTPAREAVIARYVDLPNTAAQAADLGPIDKRRKRTRRFRLWP